MALLGHVARLTLHPQDAHELEGILSSIGFGEVSAGQESIRCSDGQVLMLIEPGTRGAASLTYYAPSLQSVRDRLSAAGISYAGNRSEAMTIQGPGELSIRVVVATAADIEERSGEDNHVLGFLDAIVVPVEDAGAAAQWAQKCGFFIIEAGSVGAPMVDVTDGLVKLSFRQQALRAPYLHYTADIDHEWSAALAETLGPACRIHEADGEELVQINVADVLTIMVTNDEF